MPDEVARNGDSQYSDEYFRYVRSAPVSSQVVVSDTRHCKSDIGSLTIERKITT